MVLPTREVTWGGRVRGGLMAAALAVALLSLGCVTTGSWWPDENRPPKPCPAYQVVCTWQNNIAFVPDPAHGGQPSPGFAGRVYLFGQNIDHPLLSCGDLVVDLIDEGCQPPRWVERWNLDEETVKRLAKKDMIGWGYTVFLPSKEARPDMTKVRLRAAFAQAGRAPIYTENQVTLSQQNGVMKEREGKFQLPGSNATPGRTPGPPGAGNGSLLPPPTVK